MPRTKWALCLVAVLMFSACPAEESDDKNGNNTPDMGMMDNCPISPPEGTEACAEEGLACTYQLDCPCGDPEDFVWTCIGGVLTQPALTCSTGVECTPNNGTDAGDMGSMDMSTADMAGPDMPAEDMAPDMPRPRSTDHGCSYDTAVDMTNMANVVVSDVAAWDFDHNTICIIVSTGTTLTWNGDFTVHPLAGGVSPDENGASPITVAAAGANGNGMGTVDATLNLGGDYPYFCTVHTGIMRGVIYVD